MGLNIGDNFNYQGKKPLDSRMLFDTIVAMKNYSENYLPDITLAFNKEDGKMYVFNRTNDVDETTGKWREFEGGEGESIQVEVLPTASENVGKVYQYIGETTNDYTHDYFYESKVDGFYCFNTTGFGSVYAKSETPEDGDVVYFFDDQTQEMKPISKDIVYWDDATHIYDVHMGESILTTRNSEGDIINIGWENVYVQDNDYEKLKNKPLEKTDITASKFRFSYRDIDIGNRPAIAYALEEGAQLYYGDGDGGEKQPLEGWLLHIDGNNYSALINGEYTKQLTYRREEKTVIGETAKVNGVYKDAFRVENLTNVKINDNLKDGDVFTFRDEGQSLYAWTPLEGEPFYSEKEIPEEGDVVYESNGGVISKLPIDSYRWTTDHQAQEGFAFIRQASNPTPHYDIQVGRATQHDIIKEKYWTNAEASGESIQVSELPTATSENKGKVYQYIGDDTQDYKHDFFYENKYTEGEPGYYAFTLGDVEVSYATSETPSNGDPIYSILEGEIQQIPLEIGYWVVDAESPSGYSIYVVERGQSIPTTRDSTQDIPGGQDGYQRVSVEVQEGNYDTLKNKPVFSGTITQPGYGRTAEYEEGGQTHTYDFLSLVEELPENGTISVYDAEEEAWFDLEMQNGLAYGEDTVTRNSLLDENIVETKKEVNENYYDIIGIIEFPTPSSKYANKVYRYIGDETEVNYPNGHTVSVFSQDLVICQNINGPYYWTKYGMTTEVSSLPTDWEGGYGETNNFYDDSNNTIVSYNGKLYTGTVDWSTYQWTWEEAKFGKEYSAGDGIRIEDEYDSYAAVQGPCPEGRHIPTMAEWKAIADAGITTSQLKSALHMPMAGNIGQGSNGTVLYRGNNHFYWSSTPSVDAGYSRHLFTSRSGEELYPENQNPRIYGMPIRPFKNVAVKPNASWSTLIAGKVFYKESDGLISILVDSENDTYLTMSDKNLGATELYVDGSTEESDANCGYYYQWGNNHGFPSLVTYVTTQTDTTGYSWKNPYSSDVYRRAGSFNDWSNPSNVELWGGTTQIQHLENAIINDGVLSVNGKKGQVTLNIPQSLPELSDVNITKIKDKQIIHYDTATQKYVNVAPTEYEAGTGIVFADREVLNDCSAMQGPCPEGWHIPSKAEADAIVSAIPYSTAEEKEAAKSALHFPPAGYCRLGTAWEKRGELSRVWQSSISDEDDAYHLSVENSINSYGVQNPTSAMPIRPFKDNPVVPDSTWTETITGVAWYKESEGLISIKTGTNSYLTLMDKNLGATTVWNYGDSPTDDNCGKYFQWGNNYPFDWGKQADTQSLQNVEGYGPSEYNSNTFVRGYYWMIPYTPNLRGMQTGVQPLYQPGSVINNTITTLDSLTNVEINNVQDGDIIAYDSTSSKYKNIKNDPYIAGEGISLEPTTKTVNDYSAMRGPCPDGFHVPTVSDLGNIDSIINSISDYKKLHMPTNCGYWAGSWQNRNNPESGWTDIYWGTDPGTYAGEGYAWHFDEYNSNRCGATDASATYGLPIRAFRDEVVLPDSTWTEELAGKIWHSSALGLITFFDGTDYHTMADKNVGATTVWNDGDTCTDANVGLYFQQGNNYGYHYGDTVPTTDELIDVSSVEPSTYSSATWGSSTNSSRWDEVNADIWGEETGSQLKTIAKTGIQNLSMNESDVAFATVTLTGTTATVSNAFITAETFVDYIVKNGTPAGTITITVANGSLTLSSTASENLILLLRLEKVNSKSVILN